MLIWISIKHFSHKCNKAEIWNIRNIFLLLVPGIFFAGDLGFWHWSIRYTTVANATLFANFAPVYVTLAAVVFFRERFNKVFLIALVISTLGSIILMGTSASLNGEYLRGDILGMIAAIFYAAYLISVGRLRSKFSTATIMFWSGISFVLVLYPVCLISGDVLIPETLNGWASLFSLAWISHLLGQGLIAWALAHLSTAFSSVSLLVQPVCAALLAWVIFSETLNILQISGGLIVLSGIYLARRVSIAGV
jgi:drug/metabolite transporter (DMT)-like permease